MNETYIWQEKTYSVMLGGGIFYKLTKQENSISLSVSIEWANGEPMTDISDFNPASLDLVKLSELYAYVAKEVN
jgi:hypothetical protein